MKIIYNKLTELGLDGEKKAESLQKFTHILVSYNEKVNLISKNDVKFFFEKHIYDSLAFNLFYKKYCQNRLKVLDIGAGGGLPSIPIAICYDDIDITAVDSTLKKIKFIEYAKEELNLTNINPLCQRAELLSFGAQFDICISRAMAQLRIILEYAIPYIKIGGYCVVYKSIKAEEEIRDAKNALHLLNSEIVDKIEYSLPIEEKNKRVLIIIRKNAKIPSYYPRKNGLIKKKPL